MRPRAPFTVLTQQLWCLRVVVPIGRYPFTQLAVRPVRRVLWYRRHRASGTTRTGAAGEAGQHEKHQEQRDGRCEC
ncbi:hypothetical protein SMICM17S_11211 [Streptomyces microflavus]